MNFRVFIGILKEMLSAGANMSILSEDGFYRISFVDTGDYNAFVIRFKNRTLFEEDEARYEFTPASRSFEITWLI